MKTNPCVLLCVLVCAVGCESGQQRDASAVSYEPSAPNRSGEVERVIKWARKAGIYQSIGAAQSSIGENAEVLDEDWLTEGRKMPDAEGILLALLAEEDPRLEPLLAVQALGFVGSAKSVPTLSRLCRIEELRIMAISSLAELALPECIAPLGDVLLDNVDSTCEYYAVQGLTAIADSQAIDALNAAYLKKKEQLERISEALEKAGR